MSKKISSHQLFHIFLTVFIIAQIVFFILYFNHGQINYLKIIGYIIWILSAILGWLPIYVFKKKAMVSKGESYVKTKKLVTTGIYSIVRHPQYLAGILLSIAFIFISQHCLVIILGIPVIVIFYLGGVDEDKINIKKFGELYKEYIKKVPGFNIILGFFNKIL